MACGWLKNKRLNIHTHTHCSLHQNYELGISAQMKSGHPTLDFWLHTPDTLNHHVIVHLSTVCACHDEQISVCLLNCVTVYISTKINFAKRNTTDTQTCPFSSPFLGDNTHNHMFY